VIKTPPGWINAPLASVAEVQLGRQRSPKNHVGPNMKPYLRAANVTWDGLALNDVKEMHFSPSEFLTFHLAPGDLLLSEASGSASEVGKPAIWRGEIEDCCFQNTLLRVRTRHLEPSYLLWFFKWLALSGQFARGSRGVGIHHLGAKALSEWVIPIAPLNEQQRVVTAIEKQISRLDAGILALNRIRQRLTQMRNATFFELDSEASRISPLRPIRDIAEFVLDGDHNPPKRTPSGILYLTARHVKQGKLSVDVTTFVSAEDFERIRRRYDPRPGDVLITCVGTLGEVAIVPEGLIFAADRNLAVIRPREMVLPGYVEAILRSPRQQKVLTAPVCPVGRPSGVKMGLVAR
jgi:type I restriction enzyme, S subunit